MPRIDDRYLDSVIFVYPSLDDARADVDLGGSGFLVIYPFGEYHPGQDLDLAAGVLYAVTAKHVVREMTDVILRMNSRGDQAEMLPTKAAQWICHPEHDVAVCALGLNDATLKLWALSPADFIHETSEDGYGVAGPGDDAFFVGRFVTDDPRPLNLPTIRFGHVALAPPQLFTSEDGHTELSFLVEAHSLNGYSGSPVIVYPAPGRTSRPRLDEPLGGSLIGPQLLGIDWGHLPHWEPVLNERDRPTGLHVRRTSGMMAVVPAWKLLELLDRKELRDMRDAAEKELRSKKHAVIPDTATESTAPEFERFESLAKRLIQVPKAELDEQRKKNEEAS